MLDSASFHLHRAGADVPVIMARCCATGHFASLCVSGPDWQSLHGWHDSRISGTDKVGLVGGQWCHTTGGRA